MVWVAPSRGGGGFERGRESRGEERRASVRGTSRLGERRVASPRDTDPPLAETQRFSSGRLSRSFAETQRSVRSPARSTKTPDFPTSAANPTSQKCAIGVLLDVLLDFAEKGLINGCK